MAQGIRRLWRVQWPIGILLHNEHPIVLDVPGPELARIE